MLGARESSLMSVRSELLRQLTATEALEAMRRIEAGTYGICAQCNQPIAEARLSAKPEAIRCIDCQREFERLMVA